MDKFTYTGNELDIFSKAKNWKSYYLFLAKKYLSNNEKVLEVGAGIGSITNLFLDNYKNLDWTAIEPDKKNFDKLNSRLQKLRSKGHKVIIENITLENLPTYKNKYSTIILADVLEHIEDDFSLLLKLSSMLKSNGKILIFVPAHQLLYSEFDKQIGHFRRYSKKSLINIVPPNLKINKINYIDSVGFFASLANKFFLKSANPSLSQIIFWDTYLVSFSRILDKFLRYSFGKNIFLVISKK